MERIKVGLAGLREKPGKLLWLLVYKLIEDAVLGFVNKRIGAETAASTMRYVEFITDNLPWLSSLGIALFIVYLLLRKPKNDTRKRLSSGKREAPDNAALSHLPQLVRSEIAYVHFGWLWKDDPYLVFGIQVWNASPYDIELVGVKGSANINNTSCTREAEKALPGNIPSYKHSVADFYQPITQKHAETLQGKLPGGQPIPFDLSPIEWVGTLMLPTGKVSLPIRLACAGQFEVDGARIAPEHSQASVQNVRLA